MQRIVLLGCKEEIVQPITHLLENEKADILLSKEQMQELQINLKKVDDWDEKFLLMNMDEHESTDLTRFTGYTLITIGFNNKSSITVSSVEDDETIFCVQRLIQTHAHIIEPMEYKVMSNELPSRDVVGNIFYFAVKLLLLKPFQLFIV